MIKNFINSEELNIDDKENIQSMANNTSCQDEGDIDKENDDLGFEEKL